jgi:probable HAF family extracellular repeat protein
MIASIFSLSKSFFVPLLWFGFLVSPSLAQLYTVTDLGTLPGGTFSSASAINASAQVVGFADIDTGKERAFLWTQGGGMQDLGTLPGGSEEPLFSSGATGINDHGYVSGWSWLTVSNNAAFLWTAKKGMEAIATLIDTTDVGSINDAAEVVGYSDFYGQGFVWTLKGGEQDLGPLLGSVSSTANANNNRGQIVGSYTTYNGNYITHAYLWSKKLAFEDLGTLPGDDTSSATALNFFDNVVGASLGAFQHAFLWTRKDGMQSLGTLPGDSDSSASAINSFGLVVGTSSSADGTSSRAFLWTPWAGMWDLNRLIPSDSGWLLSSATGINTLGQIVGNGVVNGQNHAFLLTLCPIGR